MELSSGNHPATHYTGQEKKADAARSLFQLSSSDVFGVGRDALGRSLPAKKRPLSGGRKHWS
jgi:hypothetical protein